MRSVTIIVIYSPHVIKKTMAEKPYYRHQNGQDAKTKINSVWGIIINSQNPRKLAPYEIEATGTDHIMAPFFLFLFCRTVLKKEPSDKSLVDGKMEG